MKIKIPDKAKEEKAIKELKKLVEKIGYNEVTRTANLLLEAEDGGKILDNATTHRGLNGTRNLSYKKINAILFAVANKKPEFEKECKDIQRDFKESHGDNLIG